MIDTNAILSKEIKKIIGSIIELKGNKVGKTKILRRVHLLYAYKSLKARDMKFFEKLKIVMTLVYDFIWK